MADRFDLVKKNGAEIDLGSDYSLQLTFLDENDVAIDISGRTYTADMKEDHAVAAADASFSFSQPGGGTDGVLLMLLPVSAQSTLVEKKRYVYDLLEDDAGAKTRIMEGEAEVTPAVT